MDALQKEFVGKIVKKGNSMSLTLNKKLFKNIYKLEIGDVLQLRILAVEKEVKKGGSK